MGANSKIEWTDHTFNPWWGCVKVSAGCAHCYAETGSKRYGHDIWGAAARRRFFGDAHWAEPLKWDAAARNAGRPAFVFCASYADVCELLPPDHPDFCNMTVARLRLAALIRETPSLIWLLLTKRPEGLPLLFWPGNWPRNAWAGVSIENQVTANERIPLLLHNAQWAARRFVSCEPMLGPVDFSNLFRSPFSRLDWLICGGESGRHARPMHRWWVRAARDQAAAAGIAFFFKQWGEWLPVESEKDFAADRIGKRAAGRLLDGREWNERPEAAL
jgi:protein gp37